MAQVHDILKAHFNSVRRDLDSVLARLTDADVRWTPREGMRTVGGQLVEIANKETETIGWINSGVWPDGAPDNFDPRTSTVAEIKAVLESIRKDTFAYIDSMSEAELSRPVRNPNRWGEAFHLEDCPLSEVLRFIASHEWYHTGQLIAYLWMRGDDPYAW